MNRIYKDNDMNQKHNKNITDVKRIFYGRINMNCNEIYIPFKITEIIETARNLQPKFHRHPYIKKFAKELSYKCYVIHYFMKEFNKKELLNLFNKGCEYMKNKPNIINRVNATRNRKNVTKIPAFNQEFKDMINTLVDIYHIQMFKYMNTFYYN